MAEVRIEAATVERFADLQRVFNAGGDGPDCQCQWWIETNAEWRASSAEQRTENFRAELEHTPAPGLVAYVDDEPAGWVRVSPRTVQHRLPRTKLVTSTTREPLDDDSVWAITCFSIAKNHRRTGLMRELLAAATEFASQQGARVIEAYPFDTDLGKSSSNDLYVGTASAFADAGYERISPPEAKRALFALTISPTKDAS